MGKLPLTKAAARLRALGEEKVAVALESAAEEGRPTSASAVVAVFGQALAAYGTRLRLPRSGAGGRRHAGDPPRREHRS